MVAVPIFLQKWLMGRVGGKEAFDADRRDLAERMRRARLRHQHLFVGFGVAEAACKTIIKFWLKQSGMRWTGIKQTAAR